MRQPALPWRWQLVAKTLPPQAAVAFDAAAQRLLLRLERMSDERRAPLMATAGPGLLVVIGPEHALPWVDGVEYARADADFSRLWLPALWQPDAPSEALAQALHRRSPHWPQLLWREPARLIPLNRQLPVSAELLADIRRQWRLAPA
ncbi:hypothetical protein [Chromobacterium subtsugae]|uniref:bpX5 domain-containing protein n=1 Tax=Chromobacterium subtsugae TaxID=251747 RepID=UPI00096DD2DB|nr:hypothetical protein [Chromobacterium subtsugae]